MSLACNVSSTWRTANVTYTNVSSTWRHVPQVYVNISGTWRPVWSYYWNPLGWGACSATCGGGIQYQTVNCTRHDGTVWDAGVCNALIGANPYPTSQACNTQACVNCVLDMDSSLTTFWLVYNNTGRAHVTVNGVGVCPNISNTATECTASGITYTRGACNADVNTAVITACEVCY